ncbi:flagellar brake protein [Paenibacillus sp. IHBB 10380]|uniref:flagellar brake protein n=1 Tax=Paenibacillus sp. IHBB 10380 TaxID=1566358 RepID=UPI0005CFCA2B|nr:flagellar brake protein [Paenibacillus sp. IHBB 10380]AJS58014.1 glycosyl transferase [Paenibacillus sp. IHBB 10380]
MLPKINDLLFIRVDSADEKEYLKEYKSRISEMDDHSVLIEIPMQESNGHLKKLFLGDELSIFFMSEGGVKNYFNTYVIGFKEDVIRMVRLQMPALDTISQVQRRTFLRVAAELEISVTTEDMTRFVTRTIDVSGGGLSFVCDTRYELVEQSILSCWVLVTYKNGSLEHVPFKAEIVRIKENEGNRKIVMLKFAEISDYECQKLIRYCFERQFDFRNR